MRTHDVYRNLVGTEKEDYMVGLLLLLFLLLKLLVRCSSPKLYH